MLVAVAAASAAVSASVAVVLKGQGVGREGLVGLCYTSMLLELLTIAASSITKAR
jgi:hypothetical protein